MAVSGKTAAPIEAPYALSTDHPPDVPALSKAMAEREHVLLEERDVLLQAAGGSTKSLYVAGAIERTSTSLGSFGTALKVTLPKVKAKQIVEVMFFGWASATIESAQTEEKGGYLGLQVGGATIAETKLANGANALAANKFRQVATGPYSGLQNLYPAAGSANSETDYLITAAQATVEKPGFGAIIPFSRWTQFLVSAEATNLAVEIVGKATSGTVKLTNGILIARPVG